MDAWSIHKGSCGYGWLDKTVMTGELGVAVRALAPMRAQVLAQLR
jgi:hypothetical protein